MLIDFSNMEPEIIPHFVGGEGEIHAKMHVDGLNRILHGILPPGSSIGYHTHETSSEIIYILSGTGKVRVEGGEEPLKAGDCHYCPKGHEHSLINDGTEDLEILAMIPSHGA